MDENEKINEWPPAILREEAPGPIVPQPDTLTNQMLSGVCFLGATMIVLVCANGDISAPFPNWFQSLRHSLERDMVYSLHLSLALIINVIWYQELRRGKKRYAKRILHGMSAGLFLQGIITLYWMNAPYALE